MGLELIDQKVLWSPSGDLGAVASGEHRWLLPTGAISADAGTNILTSYWHKIDVSGGDYLALDFKSNITSTAQVGGTVTTSILRCGAVGNRQVDGMPYTAPRVTLDTTTVAAFPVVPQTSGGFELKIVSSNAATIKSDFADQNNGLLTSSFACIGDTTIAAANDKTEFSAWLGEPTQNNDVVNTTMSLTPVPTVRGWDTVHMNFRWLPTLAVAGITAIVLDAQLVASVYRDVQHVQKVDRRLPPRGYSRFRTPGAGA